MPDQPPDRVEPGLSPVQWRRIYIATTVWGVLTIAALWWFTAVFDR